MASRGSFRGCAEWRGGEQGVASLSRRPRRRLHHRRIAGCGAFHHSACDEDMRINRCNRIAKVCASDGCQGEKGVPSVERKCIVVPRSSQFR